MNEPCSASAAVAPETPIGNPALRRLPVTVVTGFLGAGKTTLLRHLLLHGQRRLAVIVNEFGEVGIDGDLIAACGFCPEEERQGRLVELANGCLCCTVQDEFLPTMTRLLERADQLDGIVIETSGLALPQPLVAAFGWPEIRARTRVHAVVAVVDGGALDAGHVVGDAEAVEAQRRADPSLDHFSAIEDLFAEQLEVADLVLISRADLLSVDRLAAVERRLEPLLRPGTRVLPMARGAIDPQLVFDDARDSDGSSTAANPNAGSRDHHSHSHSHVAMASIVLRRSGHWRRSDLEQRLRQLLASEPVIRLKGRLVQADRPLPLQIQAVGPRLECWYEGEVRPGAADLELVVLGAEADRDRLAAAFACL
jgi:cobalamin biosynthesis protein CobW